MDGFIAMFCRTRPSLHGSRRTEHSRLRDVPLHLLEITRSSLSRASGSARGWSVGEVDVSSLATVPFVSIIQCQFKNVNYDSLKNVPRLKITDFRRIPFQENL